MFEDKLNEMDWESDSYELNKTLSEFEKMLSYHEFAPEDWYDLSGNEQRRMWWNYRKFGRN